MVSPTVQEPILQVSIYVVSFNASQAIYVANCLQTPGLRNAALMCRELRNDHKRPNRL